jgi:hypothetical protein
MQAGFDRLGFGFEAESDEATAPLPLGGCSALRPRIYASHAFVKEADLFERQNETSPGK